MIGRQRGFIAHLKNEAPDIFAIHCVVHRQHLVAKHLSDRLHKSLQVVTNAVNKIKAHSMNDCLFGSFAIPVKKSLNVYSCIRTLGDQKLCSEVETRRTDVAYLSDIFDNLSEINIKLQGKKMNIIKAKGIIMGFISMLTLFKNNLGRHELYQAMMEVEDKLCDNDVETYCSHLEALKEDMLTKFLVLSQLSELTGLLSRF
ncbi:protein FAM200A-like [Homarus americanus]|uniref:protein FAM200A-like n=1 Tax=Homarus americanus TaxID=6706 RepID=UPI001C44E73C|nr:protein FAM200A-like [Homarus americanus]